MLGLILAGASVVAAPPISLEQRWLARHNAVRAEAGVTPLVWDETLAKDAAVWANRLARTRTFDHDDQSGARRLEGENLWMGTQGAFSPEEMIDDWAVERALYRPGRFPDVATRGTWHDVGHYTQMIWQTTTALGCAMASTGEDDVLVCRYFPAGNVVGRFATEIGRAGSGSP